MTTRKTIDDDWVLARVRHDTEAEFSALEREYGESYAVLAGHMIMVIRESLKTYCKKHNLDAELAVMALVDLIYAMRARALEARNEWRAIEGRRN
jgi:hypothetical protein